MLLAVVIHGIEPEGFRARLTEFVSNLHLRYHTALRDFNGDPDSLPNFQPQLAQLAAELSGREEKRPLTKQQKIGYTLAGILALLFILLACFYLFFTIRLLPVAFPRPTSTATATPTLTPTWTPSPTATFTPTATPAPTATPTPTPTPTTLTVLEGIVTGTVWVRAQPNLSGERIAWLSPNNRVAILAAYGDWLEISWMDAAGEHRGWVAAAWISPAQTIPPAIVTTFP